MDKNWTKFKIFMWDQLIRPFKTFGDTGFIKIFILLLIFASLVLNYSKYITFTLFLLLFIIFIRELVNYTKSGEYIHNYRKYKGYPETRKEIKKLRKEEKEKLMFKNKNQDKQINFPEGIEQIYNGKEEDKI